MDYVNLILKGTGITTKAMEQMTLDTAEKPQKAAQATKTAPHIPTYPKQKKTQQRAPKGFYEENPVAIAWRKSYIAMGEITRIPPGTLSENEAYDLLLERCEQLTQYGHIGSILSEALMETLFHLQGGHNWYDNELYIT